MGVVGKLIVAKGFKKLPKVQKIAGSGHTGGGLVVSALGSYIVNPSSTPVKKCTVFVENCLK